MSMRMELEDLPPRFRAQAEAQIADRCRGKRASPQPVADAARAAGKLGKTFESKGEYDYYMGVRFLYKGIIIKHNKTEPTYTKTSLFLCEKRRFFMARTEKGVVATI